MKTNSPNPIQLVATMYSARDAMKFLYREKYPELMIRYQEFIKNVMDRTGVDALKAMMALCDHVQNEMSGEEAGVNQGLVIAAYVEMVEPS